MNQTTRSFTIVGAGISGLAAAITLARSGIEPIVYERRPDVGMRFQGDFQGLENWTFGENVIRDLEDSGIQPTFDYLACHKQTCFGPGDTRYEFESSEPFYYLIRRGPFEGSLDYALRSQALDSGAKLLFGEHRKPDTGVIDARGPCRAFALASGYHFETNLGDGSYAVLNDELAPGGYGYLLVWSGEATLATCIFRDFRRIGVFVERTRRFFQERLGLSMRDARRIGGVGDVRRSISWPSSESIAVGESAGIQDALWGFGIRAALISGCIAGRRMVEGKEAELRSIWTRRIERPSHSSLVNRWLFSMAGQFGYRYLLNHLSRATDPRAVLTSLYRPRWWKLFLHSLAQASVHRNRLR